MRKRHQNLWRGVRRCQSTETRVKPSMRSFIQDSFLPNFPRTIWIDNFVFYSGKMWQARKAYGEIVAENHTR